MGTLKQIYDKMPTTVQTLLLNVQAFRYLRQRKRGQYRNFFDWLCRFQWVDEETIRKWQIERFKRIFGEAAQNVPYYRRIFQDAGFRPEDLTDLEQIKQFPFIEKQQIRENPDEFNNSDRKSVYLALSGGSTGAPLVTPNDLESLQWTSAIYDRYWLSAGVRYWDRSVHFSEPVIVPHHKKKKFWRYSWVDNTLYFSVYHLKEDNMPLYFKKLQEFQPLCIDGYTSCIFDLAQWINNSGLSGQLRLLAVFPTSETITPAIREEIEKAFSCPVYLHYGSTEGIPMILECPAGKLHVVPESGFIEFLREDGTSAVPGELAEMVATSFRNWSRPLLRYRIGDMGILAEEKCSCGRNWPVVKEVIGRIVETIKTPDGRSINMLSHNLLKVTSNIKQSQIIQLNLDHIVLKIVKRSSYNEAEQEEILRKRFLELVGPDVRLDIEYVEEIPRLTSGKRPPVIVKI